MRLTKKKALQITADLWGWLEKHPSKKKHEWPEWEHKGGDVKDKENIYCACCDYVNSIDGQSCEDCPLTKLWKEIHGADSCCGDGYFERWERSKSPKTKKKYARIIKEGALKELSCLNAN